MPSGLFILFDCKYFGYFNLFDPFRIEILVESNWIGGGVCLNHFIFGRPTLFENDLKWWIFNLIANVDPRPFAKIGALSNEYLNGWTEANRLESVRIESSRVSSIASASLWLQMSTLPNQTSVRKSFELFSIQSATRLHSKTTNQSVPSFVRWFLAVALAHKRIHCADSEGEAPSDGDTHASNGAEFHHGGATDNLWWTLTGGCSRWWSWWHCSDTDFLSHSPWIEALWKWYSRKRGNIAWIIESGEPSNSFVYYLYFATLTGCVPLCIRLGVSLYGISVKNIVIILLSSSSLPQRYFCSPVVCILTILVSGIMYCA